MCKINDLSIMHTLYLFAILSHSTREQAIESFHAWLTSHIITISLDISKLKHLIRQSVDRLSFALLWDIDIGNY